MSRKQRPVLVSQAIVRGGLSTHQRRSTWNSCWPGQFVSMIRRPQTGSCSEAASLRRESPHTAHSRTVQDLLVDGAQFRRGPPFPRSEGSDC